MSLLNEVFSPIDVALEMEPEELAVHLLEPLCRFEESKSSGMLNRYNVEEWGHPNISPVKPILLELVS
jgi:hypothetical protein